MYIDIHNHLDTCKDIDGVVKRAKEAGVKISVISGLHPQSNRIALELAENYKTVKCSLGLYPPDALDTELGGGYTVDVDSELAFIRNNQDAFIAIGEIGLDYKTGKNKDYQKSVFRRQLELATELKKPVIIHSRKAELDAIEILEQYGLTVIMHCFSGKKKLVHRAIENGWHFTIPTSVVRSQQYQYLAEQVPLNRMFCETDSPFMTPHPGKDNEPAFVVEAYKKVAEIRGMDEKEVVNIIFNNYQRIF